MSDVPAAAATTSERQAATTSAPSSTATPTTLETTTVTVAPTMVSGFFTGPDHVAVAYTVPDGWEALDDGWAVIKSGGDPVFGAAFERVLDRYEAEQTAAACSHIPRAAAAWSM